MTTHSTSSRPLDDPAPAVSPARFRLLVVLGAVPLLVLAVFAYLISARAVDRLVRRGNDAAAAITAALVEGEFEHWVATMTSYAGFPTLSGAIAAGDVDEVRRRLEVFVTAHPRLDRAFVTDTTALLWVDFPVATESLGRRFDDRDWYRGVSGAGAGGAAPYVSEVYRRHAAPQIQVVAIAVPVRSPTSDALAGYLVAQVRLDGLTDLLRQIEVGAAGHALLRDHTGALVAHPSVDLGQRSHREYAEVVLPAVPEREGMGRGRYTDPLTGQTMLASSVRARVGDHQWTVISQQPVDAAFAANRGLALRLGAAGLLLSVLMGGLLLALSREMARRREAERELVSLNEDLERRVEERTAALREREDQLLQAGKMEAVGQLAGGVAHDFNNLLTVILSSAHMLLSTLPEDASERREAKAVRHAAERAAELTRQLLAFSRKQVMQPKVLDVNESVERMRAILERVIGEDVQLVWRLTPNLHPVKFDPGQIEQVVMNLVVNGRDAMPRGGKLTIETSNAYLDEDYVESHPEAKVGPHVMLAVSDTGAGMDAETRKRIFEPFYTTKGLGKGTGLGLSTVYGIVRQGGGNIWVYSEPGAGTTFKIYFPRTDDVPGPAVPTPSERYDATASATLLVVEDEDSVRDLVIRILTRAGYTVLPAPDAATALRMFREHIDDIDLILSDIVLPDLRGPELAAQLMELRPDLRVVYMSGYTDNAIFDHGVLDEGIPFIQKPFRPSTLLRTISDELARPAPHPHP